MKQRLLMGAAALLWSACAGGTSPYPTQPTWQSSPGEFATGLAVTDLNSDGRQDLVFANGNDMAAKPLTAYFASESGALPATQSWSSAVSDYYTGLAAADLNHDARVDVAVTSTQRRSSSHQGGSVQVFYNGEHGLEREPRFAVPLGSDFVSFGCAFGDADADGDLDLAVAVMHLAETRADDARIYENVDGNLQPTVMWRSQEADFASAAAFADINEDGLLDVVIAATPSAAYFGERAADGKVRIAAQPSWVAEPVSNEVVTGLTVGRIGAARKPGFVIAHGDSCIPTCHPASLYRAYVPAQGNAAVWRSAEQGLAGGLDMVALASEGPLALVGGQWGVTDPAAGGPLRIFATNAQAFETQPSYVSQTGTVVESVVAAALDGTAVASAHESFTFDHTAAVTTLAHDRIATIDRVERNGQQLPSSAYAVAPPAAWLSFAEPLRSSDTVRVYYRYPVAADINVSVWTPSSGSYSFRRERAPSIKP